MKKILLAFVVLFALGTTTMRVSAQEQKRVEFYYYPNSNIYFNTASGEYWYYDEPNVKWVEVKTLPETITLEKAPSYTIYYNGEDVWKDNAMHQKKYKGMKKEGKKEEKKDEPRKDK